ncbi:MAG: response regulator [Oligoflexia bacterium]|nr:response regulator [Oligoflexia bacterium]
MKELTVLAIDDNDNNLTTLEFVLKQLENVNVIKAENGKVGLEKLEKNHIDLIIVDIQMPVMNGFEFCNIVANDERFNKIPYIFLTAYFKSEEFESRGYKLGAFDYMTKPIDEFRLLNKVNLYRRFLTQVQNLMTENNRLKSEINKLKSE